MAWNKQIEFEEFCRRYAGAATSIERSDTDLNIAGTSLSLAAAILDRLDWYLIDRGMDEATPINTALELHTPESTSYNIVPYRWQRITPPQDSTPSEPREAIIGGGYWGNTHSFILEVYWLRRCASEDDYHLLMRALIDSLPLPGD